MSSFITLKQLEENTKELDKLEIEFLTFGYSEINIQKIKLNNGARTLKEYIKNLKAEKTYWNGV